jgi:hypothetical protein
MQKGITWQERKQETKKEPDLLFVATCPYRHESTPAKPNLFPEDSIYPFMGGRAHEGGPHLNITTLGTKLPTHDPLGTYHIQTIDSTQSSAGMGQTGVL